MMAWSLTELVKKIKTVSENLVLFMQPLTFGFSQSDVSTYMYICNCHSQQCLLRFPFFQA